MRKPLLAACLLLLTVDRSALGQSAYPWPNYGYAYPNYPQPAGYQQAYPGYPFPGNQPWPTAYQAYPSQTATPSPVNRSLPTQQRSAPPTAPRYVQASDDRAFAAPTQSTPPGSPKAEEILPLPRATNDFERHLNPPPGAPLISPADSPDMTPDCPDDSPRGYRYYGRMEYLAWWAQRQFAPPLVASNVPPAVIGGSDLSFQFPSRQGARATMGYWINESQSLAIEGVFFFVGTEHSGINAVSNGDPILVRPFVDGVTGRPAQSVIAGPGQPGGIEIGTLSRLLGAEVNGRYELYMWGWGHLDALAGFRYLQFDENLNILTNTQTAGVSTFTFDGFGTHNTFLGGQLGLEGEVYYRKFFLDAWAKIALGNDYQLVSIQGNRVVGNVSTPGGLLAQSTNIGQHRQNQFAYIPEFAVNVGYQCQDHARLTVGYNFLLLGDFARPGNQIDTRINTTGTGPAVPGFSFNPSSFWIQGITAGVEFRF